MPNTALKHLAKRAKTDIQKVEYLWDKAAAIVKKEYNVDEDDGKFWALRMGITKRMLGLSESLSFKDFLNERADDRTKLPKFDSIKIDRALEVLNTHC